MALILTMGIMLTGCSVQNNKIDDSSSSEALSSNPFEEKNTEVLGSIGHELVNQEKTGKHPLYYKGGETKIEYTVTASGTGKDVGFLVYIDGVAQPYKFNSTDAPYEYMHIMQLKEDDKETPFTFIFTPVAGRKGETRHVTIVSVYNPGFMPDMKKTTSYGGYQTTLENTYDLVYEQDAAALKASDIPSNSCIDTIRQSSSPVTQDDLAALSGMQNVNLKMLDKNVYVRQLFGNPPAIKTDNLKIEKNGALHVTYQIMGHPGARYKNTFYLNHQALTDGKIVSFDTKLTKDNKFIIDVDLNLSKLKDRSTFYVVSVPYNADDFPNDNVGVIKTDSILFYK